MGGHAVKCALCGTENPAGMKFCGGCATPLTDPGLPAAPGVPRGDHASLTAGERRLVTILFADLSGFTTLSEKLDPEAVRDIITTCFDRLVPCLQRYGGTIDKFMGDEIMVLFGAPCAHENDPERALRAALEMRGVLTAFNEERHFALALHSGVNTGLVYAGGLGGGGRRDYSVMGDAVNVAARLKAAATAGEILVGVDTYRQTQDLFAWQPLGPVSVKGKAELVPAYRLLDLRAHTSGLRARPNRSLSSPLVGRGEELTAFAQAIGRGSRGQGGVLFVVGEAGLGKSRLVAEARTEARKVGLGWLEGRTLSFGRTISYWPLLEIIQQDSGIESDDSEAERWAKLAGRVTALFGEETPEILPYLATLLALPVPEDLAHKVRHLDGEAMGRQVYRATRLFFARVAAQRPTVLIVEDVHWLDGSSASLLEHLLPLTREVPLLFCFVSRPETEADTALTRLQELAREQYADRLTEITLRPLSPEESMALVLNLAPLADLPPRLRGTILEKAEGNPFFVEEVVRSLIDLGGLVRDEATGRWRVTEQATRISIPDTLQGVIMARIDRLDEDLKQVLRLASVIGRSFFYRVLAGIAEADRDLDRNLSALEARELIREKSRDPELEYIFKHALVQEATYESILLQARREIHLKVAATIEDLFTDRLDEFYGLLAYHYSKAEDWEKAQEYLLKAGDQAGRIAADAEALAHYEQAMATYTRVFGDRWDPLQRADLERKMGEALIRIGDHERGRDHLYCALESLGSPFPRSSGALRFAIVTELLRQVGHRLFSWLPRRSTAQDEERIAEERVWLYDSLSWIDNEYPERGLLDTLLALNLAERNGIDWAAGAYSAQLANVWDLFPSPFLSRIYYRRGLAFAEQAPEQDSWETQFGRAGALFLVGKHEYEAIGDWAGACDHLRRAREEILGLGRHEWSAASDLLARALIDKGELREALALCKEAVTLGEQTGNYLAEAMGNADAGAVLCAQGAFEEARAHLRSADAAFLSAQMGPHRVTGRALIAHCGLKQGSLDEARTLLAEDLLRVRANPRWGIYARNVWTGHAAISLTAAEQAQDSTRSSALNEAKAACRMLLKHGKLDIGALVPGYRMQGTYEWLSGHPDKADRWWRKSLGLAEKLGARYEGALAQLEIGRRTDDKGALQRAEAEFAEMGATFDLAEARRLLVAL